MVPSLFYVKMVFDDTKDRSIFLASATVGNTGNLGIPLGIALFGEVSVPYTSIINIANIFFIYIFSVYFFAGDKFSFKDALKEIFKIPAIWFAVAALSFNTFEFELNSDFEKLFTMGAYAAIVMQLVIFGVYLSQIKIRSANWKLALNIVLFKHVVLPLAGLVTLLFFDLDPIIASILLMQFMVPLAVNNVNLSALYDCKPFDTTFAVLLTTLGFFGFIYFYILVINHFFGAA